MAVCAPSPSPSSLRYSLLLVRPNWRLGQDELFDSASAPRHLLPTIANQLSVARQLLLSQLQLVQIAVRLTQPIEAHFRVRIQAHRFKKSLHCSLIFFSSNVQVAQG